MSTPTLIEAPADGPLLVARDLRVTFPVEGGHLRAVDGVDIEVRRGETVALVGESGSGKSTLARALMRVYRAEGGRIAFDGTDVSTGSERLVRPTLRRMQMVQQDPFSSLDPRMTVRQIMYEPLRAAGWRDRGSLRERSEEMLGEVGLGAEALDQRPSAFSGGQRQRIAIARALAPEPEMVIADEPLSALDLSVQAQLINLFADLKERHQVAYLFISHDLMVVNQIADRVVVLYLGRVVEEGPARSVLSSPLHPYTAALLSAVPGADGPYGGPRLVLEGDPPSPLRRPSGCPFHTRCPFARARCAVEEPELRPVADSQTVACLFPLGSPQQAGDPGGSARTSHGALAFAPRPVPEGPENAGAPETTGAPEPADGTGAADGALALPLSTGRSGISAARVLARRLAERFVQLVVTVFAVMTVLFFMLQFTGNPADVIAGQNSNPQELAAISAQYGLNRPLAYQYVHFIGMIFSFNFGNSYSNLQPALGLVWARVLPTVGLTLVAMAINLIVSLILGSLIGAFPRNRLSQVVRAAIFVGQGIPFYVVGLVLVEVFTVAWHLLPSLGDSGVQSWILPAVTLAWFLAPRLTRVTAVNMTAAMNQPYIQVARAGGARRAAVVLRHALPNALVGTVAFAGTQVAYLISGTLIVEEIFGWPGLGRLLIDSITQVDFPVVEACVVFIAIYVYVVNAAVDVLLTVIDPRVRRR
jgi:oligopeptide/dipeptide ABC transporter ATP-binding protein